MKRANTSSVPWWKLDADEIERHEWANLRVWEKLYGSIVVVRCEVNVV